MKRKLLLLGYSGKRNFGDDLLLKQAYEAFKESAEIHIHTSSLTNESDYLIKWFPEARVHKSSKIGKAFLSRFTHVLYFGGGVFFDYEKRDFKTYWKKRLGIIKNFNLVRISGTHFAGIGIGLGPFIDKKSETLCFAQLKNFDFLNVRDEVSLQLCESNNFKNVNLSQDLSIAQYKYYHSFNIPKEDKRNRIIICPRNYPHGKNRNLYVRNLLSVCENIKSKGIEIFVYGFQSSHDEEVLEEFSKQGFKTEMWNPDKMCIEDLLREFADCQVVISARMHGIYIAGILDVPVIGIGVHQKLKLASQLFSQSLCIPDTFELNEIIVALEKLKALHSNNHEYLLEKEEICKNQYELIRSWLQNRGTTN